MFGYIKPFTPDLRVREQDYYRAIYCGLCRTQGRCTGCTSRLTLSYDMAFLAAVRLALTADEACPTLTRRRCALHPLRKRSVMEENEALTLCACTSAMLSYHKCDDDVRDERGLRRLRARTARLLLAPMRRRAARRYPALDGAIANHMHRLSALEGQRIPSVDTYASAFGDMMADVLSFSLVGESEFLARRIGWHLGRFVYILDAYDDLEEDQKKGRFNPFLLLYDNHPPQKGTPDNPIEIALLNELRSASDAVDLIDCRDLPNLEGLLANVLHLGLPLTVRQTVTPTPQRKEMPHERSL